MMTSFVYTFFCKTSELHVPPLYIKIQVFKIIFLPQCSCFDLLLVLFVFKDVCKYENPSNLVEIPQFLQKL